MKLRISSFQPYQNTRLDTMIRNSNSRLISTIFEELSKNKELRGKWLIDELLVMIIQNISKTKQIEVNINKKIFNTAITKNSKYSSCDNLTKANETNVYMYFGHHKIDGKPRRVRAYFFAEPNELPSPINSGVISALENILSDFSNVQKIKLNEDDKCDGKMKRSENMNDNEEEKSVHHKKQKINETSNDNENYVPIVEVDTIPVYQNELFWESPEINKLFGEYGALEYVNVVDIINKRIEVFKNAFTTVDGYKMVLEDADRKCTCTPNDIFRIRLHCQYLYISLTEALKHMPLGKKWLECCEYSITVMKDLGYDFITRSRTISSKHLIYRRNKECFPNPSSPRISKKANDPAIFSKNPDLKKNLIRFCKINLNTLSVDLVKEFLEKEEMPKLLEEYKRMLNNENYTYRNLLQHNGLKKINASTINKWLLRLGYSYDMRKKTYYVDAHEKPETVEYRKKFVARYLDSEIRMHRWIHLSSETLLEMESKDASLKSVRRIHIPNSDMYELHVDSHESLFALANDMYPFGGCISFRNPTNVRPLISIGHDEVILKQYIFSPKSWTTPDGEKGLIPKDEGCGVMASAFSMRELGFALKITPSDLARVNTYRSGKKYFDEEAATAVNGNSNKMILNTSPFLRYFEYGASADGYWNYNQMWLQFEDCIDCMKVLYPTYDICVLFDHSSGHDKKKKDGLNISGINKLWGGSQNMMRDSLIADNSYLGTFNHESKLRVGNSQSMVFNENDTGPFWLSNERRNELKYDQDLGPKYKELTKKELIRNLTSNNISPIGTLADLQQRCRDNSIEWRVPSMEYYTLENLRNKLMNQNIPTNGRLKNIQQRCLANNIPIKYQRRNIVHGWMGKPKGALQILYERGFIDPEKEISYYTMEGKVDAFGNKIDDSSLKLMLKQLPDFINEQTLLQYNANKIGASVDLTPKCHPEIAGEGIEYMWAYIKNQYRRKDLSDKRGKERFLKTVKDLLTFETNNVLLSRKFSKKARSYMISYHILDNQQPCTTNTYSLIEKIRKCYTQSKKCHRSIDNSERKYINDLIDERTCD